QIQDTANGLEYLHTQEPPICHGDLKSFNILVNSYCRAVITDFGSARIRQSVASESGETRPTTLRWTAPEVLNDGVQDLPSDMWAMGWICWEIVTGRVPFEELERSAAIIMHAIKGKLPAIRENTDLSHVIGLCSLMSDCWLSEPGKR
ncbi:hypothetical protein M407DRAFT_36031, partial [Tulasnella calospora MUT 4182]